MKKSLIWALPILTLSLLFSPNSRASSNLEVATDSNFSNQTTEVSPGQTIYVRVKSENDGQDKHQLNLRDNNYNLLQSYNLSQSGDQFTTSLPTPQNEGYYSLEAQIHSGGSVTNSVKTIKVGSPGKSSVKVNVQSKVEGQSVTISNNSKTHSIQTPTLSPNPTPSPSPKPPVPDSSDFTFEQKPQSGFFLSLSQFFKKIFSVVWPF